MSIIKEFDEDNGCKETNGYLAKRILIERKFLAELDCWVPELHKAVISATLDSKTTISDKWLLNYTHTRIIDRNTVLNINFADWSKDSSEESLRIALISFAEKINKVVKEQIKERTKLWYS